MLCPSKSYTVNRAFGLVELMVSISIIVLVSTVIVTRQSAFNGAVLLRNQAYEVAFAIRQAQQLAVSGGDEAVRQYGVYFSTTDPQEYILFADRNSNGLYEEDQNEQIGLTGRIDSRFRIRAVTPSVNTPLTILFTRPNFDARFCNRSSGCTSATHFAMGPAFVDIARTGVATNGTGDVRRVEVRSTGDISVVT